MNESGVRRRTVLATVCGSSLGMFTAVASGTADSRVTQQSKEKQIVQNSLQSVQDESTVFVAPSGADDNPGTASEPVETIQEAIERVEPGETVYVNPGEYQEIAVIEKSGTPDNPIEITGPPDAVLRRPPDWPAAMGIVGDHIRLTGLSIDGLADPDRPDDPTAYGNGPVIHVPGEIENYREDLVIAPHGVGNSGRQLVNLNFVKDAEIGPFEVTGRAGAKWQLTDEENHNGEIVYIGTARSNIEQIDGFDGWDRTQNIHVHHIDNSAGHPHSRLVDVKAGAKDVTIEYCTDGGGSHNTVDWPEGVVGLAGHGCTLRWSLVLDGEGNGVEVGTDISENAPDDEIADRVGTENAIYGNEISGFEDGWGIAFFPGSEAGQGPEHQALLCGNNVDGRVVGEPEKSCPEDVPEGDGIGHTGGDPAAARAAVSDFEPPEQMEDGDHDVDGESVPSESDSIDESSTADLALYAATAAATTALFVPYGVRRLRRRSE